MGQSSKLIQNTLSQKFVCFRFRLAIFQLMFYDTEIKEAKITVLVIFTVKCLMSKIVGSK